MDKLLLFELQEFLYTNGKSLVLCFLVSVGALQVFHLGC